MEMKLFTVGPVQMYKETLDVRSQQIPYFRTQDFSEVMIENEKMLKEFLDASDESKTVFLTASGSAAMEATVINSFNESDRLLVINGGTFGKRFCDICKIHGIPHDSIDLEWDEELTKDHVEKYVSQKSYSGLLVNADETSTGQLYDLEKLSRLCKDNDMYFVVDAISSFCADEISMRNLGIDACIISSQKAMALAPGASFVVISERLYNERVMTQPQKTLYFDFKLHIENQKRGQTPFTPAVGVLLELNEFLKRNGSDKGKAYRESIVSNALFFRKLLAENNYEIPSMPISNALTPVWVSPRAKEYFQILKNKYEIYVTPCGGDLADKLIRVGHIGNLTKSDYELLIDAMNAIRTEQIS